MSEVPIAEAGQSRPSEHHTLRVRDYIEILTVTVLMALFLRSCVVGAYRIPSSSMEYTLRIGDFLLVNKFIYGVQTPEYIPLTGIKIPRFRFPAFSAPGRGDVIVFELPEYATDRRTDEKENYVKRCVALPGDTLRIVNKKVIVDGTELPLPESGERSGRPVYPNGYGDSRIFPRGSSFNEDNYGPIVVPQRGDTLRLDRNTFMYARDIVEHEGHTVRLDGAGGTVVDNIPARSYVVRQNYYFMMGDNRDNSLDSRFWGFVPEDLIIGKVMIVYWSWDEHGPARGVFGWAANVRWSRVGRIVR